MYLCNGPGWRIAAWGCVPRGLYDVYADVYSKDSTNADTENSPVINKNHKYRHRNTKTDIKGIKHNRAQEWGSGKQSSSSIQERLATSSRIGEARHGVDEQERKIAYLSPPMRIEAWAPPGQCMHNAERRSHDADTIPHSWAHKQAMHKNVKEQRHREDVMKTRSTPPGVQVFSETLFYFNFHFVSFSCFLCPCSWTMEHQWWDLCNNVHTFEPEVRHVFCHDARRLTAPACRGPLQTCALMFCLQNSYSCHHGTSNINFFSLFWFSFSAPGVLEKCQFQ